MGLALFTVFACTPEKTELTDAELMEKAKELAHKYIMVDGHVDLPYRMQVGGFTLRREALDVSVRTDGGNFDFPRTKEGGLDAPFMSIYIPARYQRTGGAAELADSLISMTERLTQKWPDKFAMAYSPDDIERNFSKGLISLPMGMENGAPVENDIAKVEHFFKRGVRYITLTHGKDNKICDSSYDTTRTHGGLSDYGKQVVSEMNRLGIMVDISHVSDDTFWQVMDLAKAPAIASHSSARKFTPGFERNMNDDMIKRLGEEDGVIMINFGSSFLDSAYRARKSKYDEHVINWLADNELTRDDPKAKSYWKSILKTMTPGPMWLLWPIISIMW